MTLLRTTRCAMTIALFVTAIPPAHAARFEYEVGVGVAHNSNVNLGEEFPISANYIEPTFGFTFHEDGAEVQANVGGLLQYRDYLSGPYASLFRNMVDGRVNWVAIPDRLYFTVEDVLGLQPIDELAADTPNNEQQTNVFAIGPTFAFRMGPTVRGQAELRYINSYAEQTADFNSQRLNGALRAIKDLDPTSTISVNLSDQYVNLTDAAAGPDYQIYRLYGRYTRVLAQLDLGVDLGYSWIDYASAQSEDRSAPLGQINLAWHATDRSSITVNGAYEYSDAASDMLLATDITSAIPTSIIVGDTTSSSQPYLEKDLGVGYKYQGARATFHVEPYVRTLDYVNDTTLNQSGLGVLLGFSWLLQPKMSAGIDVSAENVDYDTIDRTDKDTTIGVFLTRQWTPHWSWRAQLTYYDRNSTAPGQSANQNIALFSVSYAR